MLLSLRLSDMSAPKTSAVSLVHDADDENLRALIGQPMVFHGEA